MVSPINKMTNGKTSICIFRPVSVLNIFSKVYETVLKDRFLHETNRHFSPLTSAYRKGYSTQHALIRLIEKWKEKLI